MGVIGDKLKQEENRKLLANPRVQAMLNTIAYAEGADYNTRVGGGTFDDLSKKPGKSTYIKSIGQNSTAEGRYQFLNKTWSGVAKDLGLTDFSPESQDLAAVELIKRRGALDDILNGSFDTAVTKLSKEWASLPTTSGKSAYGGQKARSINSLRSVYEGKDGRSSLTSSWNQPTPIPDFTNYGENIPETTTSTTEEDTPEEKAAKENIDKITTEQQIIKDFFATQEPIQQQPQQEVQQQQEEYTPTLSEQFAQVSQLVDTPIAQQGGIPVSSQGVFASGNKPVIVPSPNISMRGVNYPIQAESLETGEIKMLRPNEEYYFKDTQNVLELPQLKNFFNKR